jgi:hypothetical protein
MTLRTSLWFTLAILWLALVLASSGCESTTRGGHMEYEACKQMVSGYIAVWTVVGVGFGAFAAWFAMWRVAKRKGALRQ